MQYRLAHPVSSVVGSGTCGSKSSTCGGVDEYQYASRMAQDYCAAQTTGLPSSGQAMPLIVSPAIFNSQADSQIDGIKKHHEYRFSSGLSGSCFVCRPISESDADED
jgi:hypothetical protein